MIAVNIVILPRLHNIAVILCHSCDYWQIAVM